jgi:chitin synthase
VRKERSLKVIFCIKHRNEGKLSSHNWYFLGFCPMFSKLVSSSIMDCGLIPMPGSFSIMQKFIETNREKVGGVCGHMRLSVEHSSTNNASSGGTDIVT